MNRIAPRAALLPLLAGAIGLIPAVARAHGIQSQLERFGGLSIQLESSFSSGTPASHAEVRLLPPGGTPIALGQTDDRGRIRFQLPPQANPAWEIQVDAGPGHRDYLEVPATSSAAAPSLSRSEAPLRSRLSHLQGLAMLGLVGACGGLLLRRPHG